MISIFLQTYGKMFNAKIVYVIVTFIVFLHLLQKTNDHDP